MPSQLPGSTERRLRSKKDIAPSGQSTFETGFPTLDSIIEVANVQFFTEESGQYAPLG